MKPFIVLLLFFTACSKKEEVPDRVLVDMNIVSTNTPATGAAGQAIQSDIRCMGSDLCYRFERFETRETAPRQFEIRAKGTYPNGRDGDLVCPLAIYLMDTTLRIQAATSGQYILRFYNQNNFVGADTVQVN